jgi:hypothetical protein
MMWERFVGGATALRLGRTCASAATALLVAACASETNPPVIVTNTPGIVIVDWTIRGTKDPNDCTTAGATTLHVSLIDSSGAPAMQYVQSCSAFATTISGLFPTTYAGSAELLDANGTPRTTSVTFTPFDLLPGQTATLAIDFPASSFF